MKKGDTYLVIAIGVLAVISFFAVNLGRGDQQAELVIIEIDGKVYRELSFDSGPDMEEIEIIQQGSRTNILIIDRKNNRVNMVDANCPDKVCLKSGWIRNPGELIVCLPNRVVIKVVGQGREVDDISY